MTQDVRVDASLEIRTSFFPLAFLLFFFTPRVSVDGGVPFPAKWNHPQVVPVPAGRHRVEVWVPYLWMRQMGRSDVVVDLAPGARVPVRWRAPRIVFNPGRIEADAPVGTAPVGSWQPDPSGRHERRYYDGFVWTEHVIDGDVQSTDPLSA